MKGVEMKRSGGGYDEKVFELLTLVIGGGGGGGGR